MSETIVRTHDLCVDFRIKSRAFGKPDILSAVRNASLVRYAAARHSGLSVRAGAGNRHSRVRSSISFR